VAAVRFRPVEVVANPRHFGRDPDAQLSTRHTLSPEYAAWALAQHRAAVVVHNELAWRGETYDDLADRLGTSGSWLRRKLTGQVPADLGDVLAWTLALGIQVWPVFNDLAELRAPTEPPE
jgi:hypothetical protein